jgi:hypothetical protein
MFECVETTVEFKLEVNSGEDVRWFMFSRFFPLSKCGTSYTVNKYLNFCQCTGGAECGTL